VPTDGLVSDSAEGRAASSTTTTAHRQALAPPAPLPSSAHPAAGRPSSSTPKLASSIMPTPLRRSCPLPDAGGRGPSVSLPFHGGATSSGSGREESSEVTAGKDRRGARRWLGSSNRVATKRIIGVTAAAEAFSLASRMWTDGDSRSPTACGHCGHRLEHNLPTDEPLRTPPRGKQLR
jgi:hypothetical protein